MKCRVAFVQPTLAHYRVPFYQQLVSRGLFDVTVFHSGVSKDFCQADLREKKVPAISIAGLKWHRGLIAKLDHYDVVVTVFDPHWLSSMIAVARPRRGKLILWGHGMGRRRYLMRLRSSLVKMADALVLYDERAKEQFLEMGIPDKHIYVAPNTIHVPNHGRSSLASRDEFIFVGRLHPRKRVDEFLQAFACALDKVPLNYNVRIVGDGAEKSYLEAVARGLGIADRVIFTGESTDSELLQQYFSRAIAYVSPGAVGLGVLHSFAYGVPVVTRTDVRHGPEVSNVRHDVTGLYYNGSVRDLSHIIVNLAKQQSVAERLGVNAYKWYVDHRSMDHMVTGFINAIRDTY